MVEWGCFFFLALWTAEFPVIPDKVGQAAATALGKLAAQACLSGFSYSTDAG
jgi:hypothetical protein